MILKFGDFGNQNGAKMHQNIDVFFDGIFGASENIEEAPGRLRRGCDGAAGSTLSPSRVPRGGHSQKI